MRRWVLLLVLLLAACAPQRQRLIFIGLDGADWQLLDRYMSDGTMPELARLVSRGERRVLVTQHPALSPLVWTTMMTGVSPLEHRILDFARFNPTTHALEPITSDERAVPAIWNMATYGGKRVDVFGMWATYPPESINGTIVSDRDIASAESDPLRRTLIETENVHRVSLERIRRDKPDLAIVYFEGTDAIGHLLPDPENATVRRYFASIDRMLDEYATLDTNLMIASDHGFRWFDHPSVSSTAPGTAAKWHRDEGVYLYVSRGARSARRGAPIRVDQICGMIRAAIGLPNIDYRRKFHRAPPATGTRGAGEEIAKLRALGYIGGDTRPNISSTRTAASYDNEGLILRQRGRLDEAQKAFQSALAVDPKSASALWNLSDLLRARGDAARSDTLLIAALQNGFSDGVVQVIRRGDIDLLTRAIAVSDAPELRLYRGRYSLQKKDCRGALADFRAYSRDDAIKYASIGTAETCLGNRSAAITAFRRSLEIDPNQPPVREFLRRLQ